VSFTSNGRTTGAALSGETWQRLVRSATQEDELVRWLASRTPTERRAFWACALLIDGRATIRQIVDGFHRLDGNVTPDAPIADDVATCASCGEHLDYQPSPRGGRPPLYHDECRRLIRLRRDHDRRQSAREAGAL
jgi:hypothetical protein